MGALVVITLIFISSGSTLLGIFRYIYNVEDSSSISRDHLILTGNILQVAAIGGVISIIATGQPGLPHLILIMAMFVLLILILYLTNFDPKDPGAQWSAATFVAIDFYTKLAALFMGYGVCSIQEMPSTLTNMVRTIAGGRR
jgi:hypothetical protein